MWSMVTGALSIAKSAVSLVGKLSGLGLEMGGISVIAKIIVAVGKALGIIEDKELEPEELGEKALAAEEEGITPEKFETYEEYLQEIEKFEVNPEKTKKYTEAEKMAKGMEVTVEAALERFGEGISPMLLAMGQNPEFFTAGRVAQYIKDAECGKILNSDVIEYLKGNIKNFEKADNIFEYLVKTEMKLDSSKTMEDAENFIDKIRL